VKERIVAGIDGGQTSTAAAVARADGTILGRGTGPPADLVGEPRGAFARQRDALAAALAAAFKGAGLPETTPLEALVIGLSGHDAGSPAPFVLSSASVELFVHDTAIAHAGALGGGAGIVVLAGTGSVALGNAVAGGPCVRAGGWGYYFGDAGSALWIAREAVALAMVDADRGDASPLGQAALKFFRTPDLRTLQHAFAHGELTRPALAAFAGSALALADRSPDPSGVGRLREAAAEALAELAGIVDDRLTNGGRRRVSYAGGVFANDGLRRAFEARLRVRIPHALIVPPLGDPLAGAIVMATELARLAAPDRESRP
jgi:glucosamine kinase